jgi:hypothetical protein
MCHAVSRIAAALTVSVCLGLMTPASTQATERWFLMSRHGDCVEVATLKRKIPDFGEINDPNAFAVFMRQQGYTVTSTRVSVPKGKAQEIKVPEKDLFLMFVTSEMCGGSGVR